MEMILSVGTAMLALNITQAMKRSPLFHIKMMPLIMVLTSFSIGLVEIIMVSRLAGRYRIMAASKKQADTFRLPGRRWNNSEPHTPQISSLAGR